MKQTIVLRITPDLIESSHLEAISSRLGVEQTRIKDVFLRKKSLDSRHSNPTYELTFDVYIDQPHQKEEEFRLELKDVSSAVPVVIIGAGPAGLFCALRLIELGLKPIVLERGKSVKERRRDVALMSKRGIVNPNSNYCFGEGGAGTFSDGKLYTRSGKRGSIQRILNIFVSHGASNSILIDSHPHIGTNKLPAVVSAITQTILNCGGEVNFNSKVSELNFKSSGEVLVKCENGNSYDVSSVVAATGHSARDFLYTLKSSGVLLESKPFALGVRVEHRQEFIDSVQYGKTNFQLPAASYALRTQVDNRGVFSFCMCPGGIICPAATNQSEVVVNGWSPSKRNSRFANSGIVVEIKPEDLTNTQDIFAGIEFQKQIEERAYSLGGGELRAPAERLDLFVAGKLSKELPECSYNPGVTPADLREVFPERIYDCLKQAFIDYNKKIKGFLNQPAIIVAPESRTSSPIRIPRNNETLMHVQQKGLFPCGEGAGYAGGIVSAAMDGERVADAVARYLEK